MKYRQLEKEEARVGLKVRFTFSDIQCMATIIAIAEKEKYPYLVRLEDGQVDGAKLSWLDLPIES